MAREPEKPVSSPPVSPDRLWAEQLAMGMGLLIALLVFMACFHPALLSKGADVLTTGYLPAYGWAAAIGVFLHLVLHEAGTLLAAWGLKVPLRFRLFAFGANATAILEGQPRQTWRDALVGMAGPLTGSMVSGLCALVYDFTDNPFFLGMACVGYFYNLFTLIPVLDLEGGWIAPAIAPLAWFAGLVISALELTKDFNLVLLGVVSFAVPRFILVIRARSPRTDLECTNRQRIIMSLGYFILVVTLAWLGSTTFESLRVLVPEAMSD
jgi:Zn-dependent protease